MTKPRLFVQAGLEARSSDLADPADYPGLPGVRKLELFSSVSPASRFNIVYFAAGSEVPAHPSPTVNYWYVLEGAIASTVPGRPDLELRRGDCCVQTYVEHGWRAGSDGAVLLAVVIDLPDP